MTYFPSFHLLKSGAPLQKGPIRPSKQAHLKPDAKCILIYHKPKSMLHIFVCSAGSPGVLYAQDVQDVRIQQHPLLLPSQPLYLGLHHAN